MSPGADGNLSRRKGLGAGSVPEEPGKTPALQLSRGGQHFKARLASGVGVSAEGAPPKAQL